MAQSISSNKIKAAFLAGNLTCLSVVLIAAIFVGYRVGFANLTAKLRSVFLAQSPSAVECPDQVLAELTSIQAVIENAGNPTNVKEHDSLLVEPNEQFGYLLRPSAKIDGYLLTAVSNFNIDPPVLYMNADSDLSASAVEWINRRTRVRFAYTTTADRWRTTVPPSAADRGCLLVGDSVCFGIGVNDDETIASLLQQKLLGDVRVHNAGVGGYDGAQACLVADRLSQESEFEKLIYIACDNDFADEQPATVIGRFAQLKERFKSGVYVLYTPYLEYVQGQFIYGGDGSEKWNDQCGQRRLGCQQACQQHGLFFLDMAGRIESYQREKATLFAGLELFSDHCHFSRAGNQLAADLIFARAFSEQD